MTGAGYNGTRGASYLLNPIHDSAFDKGLLTLAEDYCIVFSEKLDQECRNAMKVN